MSAMVCVLGMFTSHIHSMHLMSAFCRGSVSHVFSVCVRCWFGMSVVVHLGMVMMLLLGARVCHLVLAYLIIDLTQFDILKLACMSP